MSKKTKASPPVKPRNPVALNPLMKKSHRHKKSNKAERAQARQELQKEIENN